MFDSVRELKHLHDMQTMHICEIGTVRETKHRIFEVWMTLEYTGRVWMVILSFLRRNSCFHHHRVGVLVRILLFFHMQNHQIKWWRTGSFVRHLLEISLAPCAFADPSIYFHHNKWVVVVPWFSSDRSRIYRHRKRIFQNQRRLR